MNTSAFLTGISICLIMSLDSLVTMLAARRMGMTVEEVGIFFMKGIRRKIGNAIWKIGIVPTGSFVKIPGMLRQEGEIPQEGDFDQVPKSARVLVMLFDKIFFAGLLMVALLLLPGGDLMASIEGMISFWRFIFGGSNDLALFPADLAEGALFPFVAVLSWIWAISLLPIGASKTQHLAIELLGIKKLKRNTLWLTISMLGGLAILVFLIERMIRFVSALHPEGTLGVWLGLAAGLACSIVVISAIVLAMGEPVPQEEQEEKLDHAEEG